MLQHEIEIYYEQSMEIAKRLREVSKHLNYIAKENVAWSMKAIKEAWEGESVIVFTGKYAEVAMRIKEDAGSIEKIGNKIEEKVTQIFSSENKNVVTAVLRNYS